MRRPHVRNDAGLLGDCCCCRLAIPSLTGSIGVTVVLIHDSLVVAACVRDIIVRGSVALLPVPWILLDVHVVLADSLRLLLPTTQRLAPPASRSASEFLVQQLFWLLVST